MGIYDKGIVMLNGFSIAAPRPADLKYIADTIIERDSYVTNNIAYDGMLVYVKSEKKTYQFIDNNWTEFGFAQEQFIANVYDNLDSASSTLALSARQGNLLRNALSTHISDTAHITENERIKWDAKAENVIVSQTNTGLMSYLDKIKLDSISSNANNYIHPDTHSPSIIAQDANNRFVTDLQITQWTAKANNILATTTSNGLLSKEDKIKLDSIAANANNYTHPNIHPASMIVEDSTHKFVTAEQIESWNSKATSSIVSQSINGLMTKEDKIKLDSIAANANNYTHPATHDATMIVEDSTHKFVTEAQITAWNAKIDATIVSTTANGLMTKEDKIKLNGIATNANNYTHPTTHPASIIVQDANNRFVTDAQITIWNTISKLTTVTQSTNGLMSSTDKTKLDGIAEGANNYVHPDTHAATMIVEDATHKFVTDTEKAAWNAKASTAIVTTSANGLMSKEDKTKLDGIASNANNYVHPTNHAPSIITQDANNRFVTDTEKAAWNAKASTAIATTSANGLMSKEDKVILNNLVTKVAELEAKLKTAVFYTE